MMFLKSVEYNWFYRVDADEVISVNVSDDSRGITVRTSTYASRMHRDPRFEFSTEEEFTEAYNIALFRIQETVKDLILI